MFSKTRLPLFALKNLAIPASLKGTPLVFVVFKESTVKATPVALELCHKLPQHEKRQHITR